MLAILTQAVDGHQAEMNSGSVHFGEVMTTLALMNDDCSE